jgi:hypothetical protein
MPKIHRPLAITAGLAVAAATLGTGVAFAASGSKSPAAPVAPATVTAPTAVKAPAAPAKAAPAKAAPAPATPTDGDNVQSGDQTTPDTGTEAPEAAGTEAPETGTETGPSDGPGGHADPAGNVDHQFEGTE